MKHFHTGAIAGLVLGFTVATLAEDVSVTTYYPSPRGVYDELRTAGDTYLATQAAGNVGIGTAAPAAKLDVQGGDANLGGNLTVTGNSALTGTLNVTGASTLATTNTGPLTVAGAANLNNTLTVAGTSTLATTNINGNATIAGMTITDTVQIRQGGPAAGKVLKAVDGNGNAVWDYATYAP